MIKKITDIPFQPINTREEIAYQTLLRMDALCDMMSSLINHIAKKEGIAVESKKIEVQKVEGTKPAPQKKKKSTKKKVVKDNDT